MKQQKAELEAQPPMPSGTMPLSTPDVPGQEVIVDGARTVVSMPYNDPDSDNEEDEAPQVYEADFQDEDMTESMNIGEGLIQYAKKNGLAIDLETMAVVKMPRGKEDRLAAVFPVASAEARAAHPFPVKPTVEEFVSAVSALVPGESTDVTQLKQFLLANRHVGGNRAVAAFVQLKLRAQSEGDKEKAFRTRHLVMAVMKAESAITAPFRQAIKDAEARLAPHMGSPEVSAYGGSNVLETTATWLCLQAVVAEWEKRYREMNGDIISVTEVLMAQELSENKLDLDRTTRICAAVQNMSNKFGEAEHLIQRLTPEARFLKLALAAETSSEVRRIALQDFCPAEGISAEQLRWRLRSLIAGLDTLPRVSYAQLQLAVAEAYDCLADGTDDAYNLYADNMQDGGPLRFETYDLSGDEPWRQKWRAVITSIEREEDDYTAFFEAISPDLGALFGPPKVAKKTWLSLLDGEDSKAPLAQDTSTGGDDDDGWQNSGKDIYEDFERRYGLTSSPPEDGEPADEKA